ncbi:IS3 family transposase [Streptacidiphilus sp. N1-10]|uniref:IS3 family transposase n=1 Tax=Streptacidiphilus jeojiensis TaxID=3229225 RepID=A0ABV6XJL6_9ACTN
MNVHPFIEAEKQQGHNVKRACELLEVSRTAFYARRSGTIGPRRARDLELTQEISAVHAQSHGTYGAPRVHTVLQRQGQRCGRRRVARLMRQAGLQGAHRRRRPVTTVPDTGASRRPDLINRQFTPDATALNQRWCGDITYIPTDEGWLYLTTVIDIASRRIVGWATADHLRTELVAEALQAAHLQRRPPHGVIFHADRGCQGGFNRSSQHLVFGGVDGSASRVDAGVDGQVSDEVAGGACASAGGGTPVLAGDRQGVAR